MQALQPSQTTTLPHSAFLIGIHGFTNMLEVEPSATQLYMQHVPQQLGLPWR